MAVVSTAIAVVFSTMGGYAFAKFRFPGNQILFDIMFSSMMIPITVLVIPLFVDVAALGLGNTYVALILPWLAPAFGIFMMRQFIIQAVPDQMIEAARIDGAGELTIFFRIVMPVIRPALGALAVWLFLTSYNNFMWPLIVLADSEQVHPAAGAELADQRLLRRLRRDPGRLDDRRHPDRRLIHRPPQATDQRI